MREPGWGHDTLSAGPDGCAAPATRRFLRGQPIDGCGRLEVTPAQAVATAARLPRSSLPPR